MNPLRMFGVAVVAFTLCFGCCSHHRWFDNGFKAMDPAALPLQAGSTQKHRAIAALGKPDLEVPMSLLPGKLSSGRMPQTKFGTYRNFVMSEIFKNYSTQVQNSDGEDWNSSAKFLACTALVYKEEARYASPSYCNGMFTAFVFLRQGDQIISGAFINPWHEVSRR